MAILREGAAKGHIRIIANEPDERDEKEYREKMLDSRQSTHLPDALHAIFLEVTLLDSSEFSTVLNVEGEWRYGYRILKVSSPTVPNAIAAVLMKIKEETAIVPDVYFQWTEGNPITHLLKFFMFGVGEVAPVTREVLRRAEKDAARRPHVHVG